MKKLNEFELLEISGDQSLTAGLGELNIIG